MSISEESFAMYLETSWKQVDSPNDLRVLKKLVEDISYNNSISYFGFDK